MYFHTHVHSEFSTLDGMADIATLAEKASKMGQPAIGITDHGNMSGAFQLYKEAKKNDLVPFLGNEVYFVDKIDDKKAKRFHLTLLAYTTQGYQNLVKISSLSQQRDHYHFKPRLDWLDMMSHDTSGIACLTGCYFSLLCQTIVAEKDEDVAVKKAKGVLSSLKNVFDTVFVEIQHHHTDHDDWDDERLVKVLNRLAQETGTPTIITNDCHYCDKGHVHLHDMMKSIAYSSEIGDVSFPGDSYHLASTQWVKNHYRHQPEVWESAQQSYLELLDMNTLAIPTLDKYKYYVPELVKDADKELSDLCYESYVNGIHQTSGTVYEERLEYELEVIKGLGMADYFLLVNDYVQWCRDQGILVMARGSAAGSLVCWLLGFTQVDPIRWNLTFDRFLTPDRERPPDIDLDIEDVRRADVVEYLQNKYEVTQIGTYNRLTYDEETGRGGLFVQYISAQRKILGDKFPQALGRVKDLHDLHEVRPEDARRLKELDTVALRRSAGAHAAGFVVASKELPLEDWVPTMLIPSSDTTVTQMMMDDVEDAGYIKIDLLGLRSLTTLRRCLEEIGRDGTDWIPLDDHETFKFLRRGITETGIFQLEGYTAAKGCRQMKVKSVEDLILVNALYRPATRNSGYTESYLARKQNKGKGIVYTHPIFEKHLKETYGVPCFQEQILAVLRDLGMPVSELNDFLKAVKGKHAVGGYSKASNKIFDDNYNRFLDLCKDAGMSDQQAEESWELVEGFAAYGFNRAHATAYSLLGYQLAYLKIHFPLEFHAVLLETTAGGVKEKQYIKETRRMKIKILPVCVNNSDASWRIDPSGLAIRKGLSTVKGVGYNAAHAIVKESPFNSIDEIIERCPARIVTGGKSWKTKGTLNGVLAKLRDAGAFKSFGVMPERN